MKARGYWLTSANKFLVEIADTLTARYGLGQLTRGHVSVMIGLLGSGTYRDRISGRLKSLWLSGRTLCPIPGRG
jgi:hypothetical protein